MKDFGIKLTLTSDAALQAYSSQAVVQKPISGILLHPQGKTYELTRTLQFEDQKQSLQQRQNDKKKKKALKVVVDELFSSQDKQEKNEKKQLILSKKKSKRSVNAKVFKELF